ncbi:predicted protein [Coccidioides posadasii str. Silveira]|uniref:Predicted protein n=1 Tax=Coccidioides posadasii (strain RMSCC 757 / Silveira) TaxID=443226 RepID=E9DDU1_COCPS|nr:predicted protein [Coccidioides posadasii str. Silveira]
MPRPVGQHPWPQAVKAVVACRSGRSRRSQALSRLSEPPQQTGFQSHPEGQALLNWSQSTIFGAGLVKYHLAAKTEICFSAYHRSWVMKAIRPPY